MTPERAASPEIERRRHRRYERSLLLENPEENGFPALETMNVSLGGCLCRVDRYLRPMTRLNVVGRLPGRDRPLEAEAVVVRVEPEREVAERSDYRVALFFQRMAREDREALRQYLEG